MRVTDLLFGRKRTSAKCMEFSRCRTRSRAPSSILSNSNSRSRRRVHLGAQLPTMLTWKALFIPTRTRSPSCARASSFSSGRWNKIRSSVAPGRESQRPGCGWLMPLCLRSKLTRRFAMPRCKHYNSTIKRPKHTFTWPRASAYSTGTSTARKRNSIAQSRSNQIRRRRTISLLRSMRREEALETLNAAVAGWGYRPGDAIAHVHVTLGAHDDAIRELEHACEQRSSSLHGVGVAPEFVPLRSDKRFRSILQRIGLEPEKVFAATAP